MSVPPEQAETVAFLRSLAGRDPTETHISLVFVGRGDVWKLKKAVRLSFLDFTTIEARRRFTEREFVLNAPTAPGLYRAVVPVVRTANGLAFGGPDDGDVVDWVLRMAPVPAGDFLDRMAEQGGFAPARLDSIADAVSAYHARLPPLAGTDPAGNMRRIADGNFAPARAAGLPAPAVHDWRAALGAALAATAEWQRDRARRGFVRRAHGDLHLGNMCLWGGEPVLFDALEFDEALATIDLAYDLAFLLMDLDRRAGRAAANRVFNRYIGRSGDAGMVRGLPAFLSLRAMIRAHVEATRGNAVRGADYLEAAHGYLGPARPIMVGVGGLQGTGKSTLAAAIAPALGPAPGALHLRSDMIRKRLAGVAPETRLPPPAYTEAASAAVFADLFAAAGEAADAGHAVIADATFLDPATRDALAAAARRAGVPFLGLWLRAPVAELERRIAARTGDASDATVDVLRATVASGGAVGVAPDGWVSIDASEPKAALDAGREAVRAALGAC